jgi:small subunit ribosomal protein S2
MLAVRASAPPPSRGSPREYRTRHHRAPPAPEPPLQARPRRPTPPPPPPVITQQTLPSPPPLESLLSAGAHWGQLAGRASATMSRYVYADEAPTAGAFSKTRGGRRRKYDIIDVVQTQELLAQALDALARTAAAGREVLFVGTSPAARQAVCVAAQRCGEPFVATRWVGGTLTNFRSMQRAIAALETAPPPATSDGDGGGAPPAAPPSSPGGRGTKKAAVVSARAAARNARRVGTLRGLTRLPGAVFVVDAAHEAHPLAEAAATGVTTIAVCDTNTAHPEQFDFPLPANARAPATVRLLCELAARAVLAGKRGPTPEDAHARHVAAAHAASGDAKDAADRDEDASDGGAGGGGFYEPWGITPLRSGVSGVGRPRGRARHKQHRVTRSGRAAHGGGTAARTQRRLGAA